MSTYEVEWSILGPKPEHEKHVKIFNRSIRWTAQGLAYEARNTHVNLIIQGLDLANANGSSTPFSNEEKQEVNDAPSQHAKLSPDESNTYRRVTTLGNYLGHDRPDVQVAIKPCSKSMSDPTSKSWEAMKKVG